MPIGAQPRGARGTVGHPYSALTLRLVLAAFGLVALSYSFLVDTWWLWRHADVKHGTPF